MQLPAAGIPPHSRFERPFNPVDPSAGLELIDYTILAGRAVLSDYSNFTENQGFIPCEY